jgi:hypothetical protein
VTLFFSLRHAVVPSAITLAFLELAVVEGRGLAWVVVAGFVLLALLATRRIDLTRDGIAFVPLVPLLRRLELAWADVGPFERRVNPAPRVPYDFVKASVAAPARFRMLWLFPTRTIRVAMIFAPSPLGRALTADEFVALTESVRGRQ